MWFPQVSFRNGEISPVFDGLSNPELYESSCRKVEGGVVSTNGTIKKRGGTRFVADTEFSTSNNGKTYTSDACKLIPFIHGTDIYVLVFEVMSDDQDSWGIIRAVVNNTLITSIDATTPAAEAWTEGYNLPFRTITAGTDKLNYWPPGTDDTSGNTNVYTGVFGQHNFTAAQLPDLQYFQHEEILVVMHPDAVPLQVYQSTSDTGISRLATRPYECKGRSPGVKRVGERFSMVVTRQSEPAAWTGLEHAWDVETTRHWFDEDDMFAIYRIGHARKNNPAPYPPVGASEDVWTVNTDYNDWGEDLRGVYAMVTRVHHSKKAEMRLVSSLTWFADSTWEFKGFTDDPFDWDGPWLPEDTTKCNIDYRHQDPPNAAASGAGDTEPGGPIPTPTAPLGGVAYGHNPTQVVLQNVGLNGSAADKITNLNQLVGCVVTKQVGSTNQATDEKALAMVAMTGTDLGGDPASDGTNIAIAYNMVGTEAPSATQPTWEDRTDTEVSGAEIYRLRDKSSKALLPTITMAGAWDSWANSESGVEAGYYRKIAAGDDVFLYVGNVPDSDIFKHIPENHDAAIDTTEHGDVANPTAAVEIGGVVHINGGSFALKDKKDNCYLAYCLVAPIHQSVTSKFELGWSTAIGFPGCGVSHQGRVLFSGFTREKGVVVGSLPDDPTNFSLGADASDGMHFVVNDLRGSAVKWLASGKDLIFGTESAEFSMTGSPLSSLSVGVDRQSAYGSGGVHPVIAGNLLLYVQKDLRTIRAMKYNFDNQRYISLNITSEHEHMFSGRTIKELIVWEDTEDPVVLVRLSDGEVLSCRVSEKGGFFGWSRMKFPLCSSICPSRNYAQALNGRPTTGDDFYISIEGTNKYRLCRFEDELYLDESVTPQHPAYSSPNLTITLPTGVSHLDGTTVSVVLDGLYRGEFACTGGVIVVGTESATTAAPLVRVGKKISMVIQPRIPESAGTPRSASTLGRNKNISSVAVAVNATRGLKVNGYEIDNTFTQVSDADLPTAVQGWSEVPVTGVYGVQPVVEISSDRPYAAEVFGVTMDMSTEG